MSTILTCRNCEALENIVSRKVNWFNLLSAENISLHHSLAATREQIKRLNSRLSNLQKSSFSDQLEIIKLYIETEYLKRQINKKSNQNNADIKLSSVIKYHKQIKEEQLSLVENEADLYKQQKELHIQKLEEHIKVLIDELQICHRELMIQSKQQLNEQRLFKESIEEEKLKSEVQLNNYLKTNTDATHFKMQAKFNKILQYKDEQIRRQDDLILVLRKQQEAIYGQFHKLAQNKEKGVIHYKESYDRLKIELEKLRLKYDKLEKRRLLEAEGYQTQIRLLNNKKKKA